MRILKKLLVLFECLVITVALESEYSRSKAYAEMASGLRQKSINIDVVVYNFDDVFISMVRQGFEEIQKQNAGKVVFKFFDGKGNQAIQNEVIDEIMARDRQIFY